MTIDTLTQVFSIYETLKEIIDAFDGVVDEKLRSIVKQIYD